MAVCQGFNSIKFLFKHYKSYIKQKIVGEVYLAIHFLKYSFSRFNKQMQNAKQHTPK